MVWGWPMTWLCTSVGSCVTISCTTLRLCQYVCDCVCSCNGVTMSEPVRGYYTGMSLWMWFLCVVSAWLWMRIELWVCMWNFGCAYGYIPMWLCGGGEHDCLGTAIDDQWCQHSSQPIMWFSHSFSSSSCSSTKLRIYLRDCHICQCLSQASLVLNTIGFFTIIWKFARGKKFVRACQILHILRFSTFWRVVAGTQK